MTPADADLGNGLAMVAAGLEEVLAAGMDPADSPEAIDLIQQLEALGRQVDAARVDLVEVIDRKGLYRADGHHSAKVMVRHVAKLSGAEAAARAKTARALRDLPETRAAFRAGHVGTCQVRRLARVHANPLVRDRLGGSEDRLLGFAMGRDFKFFDHFVDAEFLADWEKARIEHGDATTKADLERTEGQRRFDALFAIFQKAAATEPGGKAPEVVTNLVIDDATYERILVFLATGVRPEVDPDDKSFRCSTIDGHPLEPTEAVAASMLGRLRRVVVGADGVVIDLGRTQRLFTGSARLAAHLGNTECFWPGCHVPVSQCQIDHLVPFTERDDGGGGGRTNPGNGGPACGKHNRYKEHGFTVWRDTDGRWHTHRPDGTEIA